MSHKTKIVAMGFALLAFACSGHTQQSADPAGSAEDLAPRTRVAAPHELRNADDCGDLARDVEHGEAIDSFCHWVLSFRNALPNILSDEKMKRMRMGFDGYWHKVDVLSMKAHYAEGLVQYSDLAIDGKRSPKTLYELEGSWSTGEFGSVLEGILVDVSKSRFKFTKVATIDNQRVLGFEYDVKREENGSWTLLSSENQRFVPGYKGRIWLDEKTFDLVQVERATTEIDPQFPVQLVTTVIKYAKIDLADGSSFVLPISSESLSCMGKHGYCLKNEITFEKWRKFGAEHRIMTDTPQKPG